MSPQIVQESEHSGAAREHLVPVASDQSPIPAQAPQAAATVTFGSLLLQASYWPDAL